MSVDSAYSAADLARFAAAASSLKEAIAAAEAAPVRKRKTEVRRTSDFDRVVALPRRDPRAYLPALTDAMTSVFARHEGVRLFDDQAIVLYEIAAFGGFCGNITMGGGKTLISLLACAGKRGLILLPANLIPKTYVESARYAVDWKVPGNITFKSYQKLSRVSHASFLESLRPEIIICDEGHALKRTSTAVHRRLRRYLHAHPECAFVIFSGTLIGETLTTWAHVADWALHDRSPAPRVHAVQEEWSQALSREPVIAPGALTHFGDDFRAGYRDHVAASPGVYITPGTGVSNALEIERFECTIDEAHATALDLLADSWELPTGETLSDPLALHRAARQLELGCYYRWVEQPPEEWREARLEWARTVREIIRRSRSLDTELAVVNAIDQGRYPEAKIVLDVWRQLKPTFTPITECKWVTKLPIVEIAARAHQERPAIIWLHHAEIGKAFEEAGITYYGAGGLNAKGEYIESASGRWPIAASIESNHKGRNLQHAFSRSIIAECPRDPLTIEQLIARTHRVGQREDTVSVEVHLSTDHSRNGWKRTLERAAHIQKTSGQPQRLLAGTHVNPLTDSIVLLTEKEEDI